VVDLDTARAIALALPQTVEGEDRVGFAVRNGERYKGFAWVWRERVDPKQPKVPNQGVLAVRVDGAAAKADLLAADPVKFFTEDHYNGFPAVLVRLAEIDADELRELLVDAWRCQAPKALLRESGL
jgi:hypothetical protein